MPHARQLGPILALLTGLCSARAQLAHEPFAGSDGAFLHGLAGGTGFAAPWAVIGFDGNAAQFRLATAGSPAFSTLSTSGAFLRGGYNNTTASRRLDVAGAFSGQVVAGSNPAVTGLDGTTLWVSALLRKDTADDVQTAFSLVNADDISDLNAIRVGMGYYGANSNNGGQRFWSMLVNNPGADNFTILRSTAAITPGTAAFLVLRIQFGASDRVDFFVNPAPGATEPAVPALTRVTAGGPGLGFRTVGFWSSSGSGNAALDEIRLGSAYADVAPTNVPPAAPGVLAFAQAAFTAEEGVSLVSLRVRRTGGAAGPVSVTCAPVGGSATAGRDYTASPAVLAWADGDSSEKTFAVAVLDDAALESAETIALALTQPQGGATLGAVGNATVTIADNDGPAVLAVANASFEDPVIADDSFATTQAPPGWAAYGNGLNFQNRTIGVLNPPTGNLYFDPVPDGANVGVTFLMDNPGNQTVFSNTEAGLQQTLSATLRPFTRYTLRVQVGDLAPQAGVPFAFTGFPGYRVDLMAGTTVLASDNDTLRPGEGRFLTSTVTFSTVAAPAQLGQPLGIRLVNLNAAPGIEVNFDDVRLETAPIHPPLLVVPPAGAVSNAGSVSNLVAEVEGTPPFGYAWTRDGSPLPGATNAVLSLGPVSRAHTGLYRLTVTNAFGAVQTDPVLLRVRAETRLADPEPGPDGVGLRFRDADGGALGPSHAPWFDLYASPGLTPADWQPIPGTPAVTNGFLRFLDPGAMTQPRRFYQVRER